MAGPPASSSGAHVHGRPSLIAPGGRVVGRAAGAQIHEHDAPSALAEHISGLDIAVEQAGRVHGGQCAREVQADEQGLLRAEHAVAREDLVERVAFQKLHPDASHPVMTVGAEHSDNMRVIEAGEEAALLEGFVTRLRIRCEQLERDLSGEPRVPGAIHRTARAATDFAPYLQVSPVRRDRAIG